MNTEGRKRVAPAAILTMLLAALVAVALTPARALAEEATKTVELKIPVGQTEVVQVDKGVSIPAGYHQNVYVFASFGSDHNTAYFQADTGYIDYLGVPSHITIGDTEYVVTTYIPFHVNVYEYTGEHEETDEEGTYAVYEGIEKPELSYDDPITSYHQYREGKPVRAFPGYKYVGTNGYYQPDEDSFTFAHDVYYIREEGTYTMVSPSDTGNVKDSTGGYVLRGVTSQKDGHPVPDPSVQGIDYLMSSGHMYVSLDDGSLEKVWCVQPEVPTWDGSKYEVHEVPENVRAAIATIYGSAVSDLDLAIIEGYVWSCVGYDVPFERMGKINPDVYYEEINGFEVQDLSPEELEYVLAMVARINAAVDAYEEGRGPDFVSLTEGVTIADGKIAVDGELPETIRLRAQNPEMLDFYANGGEIAYPTGVTGAIDLEKGELTLALDATTVRSGSVIEMSMVPSTFSAVTRGYYSKYDQQALDNFGIADRKVLTLVFQVDEPTAPSEPAVPSEPTVPQKPEAPKAAKREKLPQAGSAPELFRLPLSAGLVLIGAGLRAHRNEL